MSSYFSQSALVGITVGGICLLLSWLGTGWLIKELNRRQILDRPNDRSSHTIPTPRGGGLAIMMAVCGVGLCYAFAFSDQPLRIVVPVLGALSLAGLSFLDDVKTLPASLRLFVQLVACFGLLAFLWDGVPASMPLLGAWLPEGFAGAFEFVLTGFAWVWFLNLYNFMDGIDGIAGVETASLGGAIVLASLILPASLDGVALGCAFIGASLGFLRWNWHPAKIFMGDVGSVPLGFLLGWLLLELAWAGAWLLALLPPLYYVVDATVTLIRRLLRGEKIWQAHRCHFYQQAVQKGRSHADVARAVLWANLALLLLAFVAEAKSRGLIPLLQPHESDPWAAFAVAILIVVKLIRWMQREIS